MKRVAIILVVIGVLLLNIQVATATTYDTRIKIFTERSVANESEKAVDAVGERINAWLEKGGRSLGVVEQRLTTTTYGSWFYITVTILYIGIAPSGN